MSDPDGDPRSEGPVRDAGGAEADPVVVPRAVVAAHGGEASAERDAVLCVSD